MSNQNMSSQNIPSDLVVELSLEEQQLLSGGHGGGGGWGWGHPRRRWGGGWGRRPRRHW